MRLYRTGGNNRIRFNSWDAALLLLLMGLVLAVGKGFHEMRLPIAAIEHSRIALSPSHLPEYALRTVLRMFIAILISLVVAILYGGAAAKSKRAEHILIPILDIFQSVPILGILSFTVTGFIALFPGSSLGLECAVIFAAFTNQVPNMIFSFYQSLKTLPKDLTEACAIFKLSPLARFLRLELPFATQGLIWNSMMSMAGGWFLLVSSEAVTIGNRTVSVPGLGSYIAKAVTAHNLHAMFYAIIAMYVVIFLYDQIIFRPLIVWADKFRYETSAASIVPSSLVLRLFKKSNLGVLVEWVCALLRLGSLPLKGFYRVSLNPPLRLLAGCTGVCYRRGMKPLPPLVLNVLWYGLWLAVVCYGGMKCYNFISTSLSSAECIQVVTLGFYTLLRVMSMVLLAIIVWVPVGVYIGLRPTLTEKVAPIVQFAAAFPANFLFPFAVMLLSHYHLSANIWLSPLMILGTQWYILFNVIAGTASFPTELKESASLFHIKGLLWWKRVMIPGLLPYIITGAITASGGAWNASIVAEVVSWGHTTITARGLGSYITAATHASDYPRIAAGIVVMSLYVIVINHLIWRPLHSYAVRKGQLN